jgi:peptide/nickel transport system substrate-binding protein
VNRRSAARVAVVTALVGAAVGATNASAAGTLVFAASADPIVLDGALVSDGESARAVFQIFESLVALRPGSTKVEPLLATSWKASADSKTWTFSLRPGVTFHDATKLNAAAVCFNFERWFGFKGSLQLDSASYYWQTVFGGFKDASGPGPDAKDGLYKSCTAVDDATVRIELTRPSASFLGALALPAFAIASPDALQKYGADEGAVNADGIFQPTGTFGSAHPIGSGPFKFESWTRGDRLVLARNDGYWGTKPSLDRVIIRPISDNSARLQALQNGEIQGYDNAEPQDVKSLQKNTALKVIERPAFNVGYVGFNSSRAPTNNKLVRQAIAYGLDRKAVVDTFYAGRGQVAREFQPPQLFGWTPNVIQYPYNPAKAKALLRKAGLTLPVKIEFWYPTDVSRPYMPDPKRNFQGFQASLEKSGFKVIPKSAPWSPDYVGKMNEGKNGNLYLFGWTGDYGDPDNFLGTFFQQFTNQWSFKDPKIFSLLNRAERETRAGARTNLYQQANRYIMGTLLPGVPYVHTKPVLAFSSKVSGYIPSPVALESFAPVTLS